MKNLPVTIETYMVVDYYDVQKLIQDHFNLSDWSVVDDLQTSNDTSERLSIDGKLDKYQEKEIAAILSKEKNPAPYLTPAFLNYLCRENVIKPGNYLITITW